MAICPAHAAVKLIPVERLAELGLTVRNLTDLLANLEGVLAEADLMAATDTWMALGGRWAAIRYPLGNGVQ